MIVTTTTTPVPAKPENPYANVDWRKLMAPDSYVSDKYDGPLTIAGYVGTPARAAAAAILATGNAVPLPLTVLGLAGAGLLAFGGIQALRTNLTGADVAQALGKELPAERANAMAESINGRMKVSGALKLAGAGLYTAALLTGNPWLGVASLASSAVGTAYTGYRWSMTGYEVSQVIQPR